MQATSREALLWYQLRAKVAWLNASHAIARAPVTGSAPVVVSMTTHGKRLAAVHTSLQSIAAGRLRPQRLVLWLNREANAPELSPSLLRLQSRGLEVRYAPNYGPHTKFYPHVCSGSDPHLPLVTADDDVVYPPDWLERLFDAHQREPETIHCFWGRRITFEGDKLRPYLEWQNLRTTEASPLNFALGVSGVIYPPAMLAALREAGDGFKTICPKNDDVWLHAAAIRNGYRISQLRDRHLNPRLVPRTQEAALHHQNHLPTGNDPQIRATYSSADLNRLRQLAAATQSTC